MAYPRIYVLLVFKSSPIEDYRWWQDDLWIWDVKLRRRLFDWELDIWNAFMLSQDGIKV